MNHNTRFVLFTRSNTQRVVVTIMGDQVLLSKEWRKFPNEEWSIGKGIMFPRENLEELGQLLGCQDRQKLDKILSSKYEVLPAIEFPLTSKKFL